MVGLEPTTSASRTLRSGHLNYIPIKVTLYHTIYNPEGCMILTPLGCYGIQ